MQVLRRIGNAALAIVTVASLTVLLGMAARGVWFLFLLGWNR